MAIQKITGDVIATSAVTADSLADTTITAAKLHTTLDLTGKTVTVATASAGDNDTTVASTAFVATAVANLADSAPDALNTLNELAAALGDDANFSTTVTNSIATKLPLAGGTMTGNISLGDNNKAIFGTGNDLQLYHSSGNSYIDNNKGALFIRNNVDDDDNNNIILQAKSGEYSIICDDDGAVTLYHDNSPKLDTTSSGIDVTGTINSGNIIITDAGPQIDFIDSDNNPDFRIKNGNGTLRFTDTTNTADRLSISGIGDISFYEDTGSTAKLFWDASAESLGIGNTVASSMFAGASQLVVGSGTGDQGITIYAGNSSISRLHFADGTSGNNQYAGFIAYAHNDDKFLIGTGANGGTDVTIDGGKLGIGVGSPDATLHVASSSAKIAEFERIGNQVFDLTISDVGEGAGQLWFNAQTNDTGFNFRPKSSGGTNTNALYIAPDGDIGIGTTNPSELLHMNNTSGTGCFIRFQNTGGSGVYIGGRSEVMEMYTNGSEKMRIDSSGNVGIGINSPGSYATDDNSLAVLGQIRIQGVTNTAAVPILALRDTNSGLFAPASNIVSISAGATERMFVTGTGRVHIGHTTRTGWDSLGTLVVQQAEANAGVGIVDAGGNNTLKIENNNTTSSINHNLASNNMEFGTGGSGHLYIQGSTGNVGIGNSDPSSKLEVGNGSSTYVKIRNASSGDVSSGYSIMSGSTTTTSLYGNAGEGWTTLMSGGSLGFRVNQAASGFNPMNIDTSGRITMPYQPCFDAAGVAGGDDDQINFTTTYINVGGHYSTSTYRFTAPVAGNYLFYTNFIKNNQSTTTNRRRFLKNGSVVNGGRHIRLGGEGDNNYDWGSISQIITLAANDYVTVDHFAGNTYGANDYDSFGGYLIG